MNTIMKKGFIFDIDGTLYSQKAMRMKMLKRLLFFYAVRPNRLKELFALKSFFEEMISPIVLYFNCCHVLII